MMAPYIPIQKIVRGTRQHSTTAFGWLPQNKEWRFVRQSPELMAETVGIIIILVAIGIGCWRFFKGRKLPASGLALLALCCFVGVALVLNKRVSACEPPT
jgi:hypothetical protein